MSTQNKANEQRVITITIPAGESVISTLYAELTQAVEAAVIEGRLSSPEEYDTVGNPISTTPYELVNGEKVKATEVRVLLFKEGYYLRKESVRLQWDAQMKQQVANLFDRFTITLNARKIEDKQAQVAQLQAEIEELKKNA